MEMRKLNLTIGLVIIIMGAYLMLSKLNIISDADTILSAAILVVASIFLARLYIRDESKWWAIIPAGILFTITIAWLVTKMGWLPQAFNGIIFTAGSGLTFLYLWMQKNETNKLNWAIAPAGIFALVFLFQLVHQFEWVDSGVLVAILLFGAGLYLVGQAMKKKHE